MHYNCLNEFQNCQKSILPKDVTVGMMGTMFVGTDRYMIVVIRHPSEKHITIEKYYPATHGKINTIDGIDYVETVADPDAREAKLNEGIEELPWYEPNLRYKVGKDYSYRKNGRWMPKGQDAWGTCSIHIGHAEEFLDPDF